MVHLNFERDGFLIASEVLSSEVRQRLTTHLGGVAQTRNLLGESWCREIVQQIRSHHSLASVLSPEAVAVQCTYFDKSENSNWLVAYHQDLSIPVRERVSAASCSAWTQKEGITYVQPSVAVLEALVAVRLHIDESHEHNGPLRVIPGSHRAGRIKPEAVESYRAAAGERVCLAPAGSALLLRPLLLHASSKSRSAGHRRILHFVFGPTELPDGLAWHAAV